MVGIFFHATGKLIAIANDEKTAIEELYKRNGSNKCFQFWWETYSKFYDIEDVAVWGNKSKWTITIEEK